MGATSVTGTGLGDSAQLTGPGLNLAIAEIQRQLREMAAMPAIIFAGSGETVSVGGGDYEFEFEDFVTLGIRPDDYIYLASAEGEHPAWIVNVQDDVDGNLTSVTVRSDAVVTVSLAVIRKTS